MPRAELAKRWFDEEDGLPPEKLINCFAVPFDDPYKGAAWKITHVPGLGTATASIAAAGRGLWYDPNTIDARLIGVFGTDFYTFDSSFVGTDRGNVASSTRLAKFAASPTRLQVLSGQTLYSWDGTTLTAVTDADLPGSGTGVEDIAYLGQRHLAIDADSHNVFYSDLGSSTSYTALGYLEASYDADWAVALCTTNDTLYIFGKQSIELWGVTTDADNPYQRRLGIVIEVGCLARDSVVRADGAIWFVSSEHALCRLAGGAVTRVPRSRWLSKKIEALSNANQALIECQTFIWNDQTIIQVSLPSAGTFWFNVATGEWCERATAGASEAACRVWTQNRQKGGTGKAYGVLCAGGRTADLYTPTGSKFTDGASAITRTFTAFIPSDRAGVDVNTICVVGTPGRIATGADPALALRCSHNGGQSLEDAISRSFGVTGAYGEASVWQNPTGSIGPQGLYMQFSTPAAAPFDVVKVTVNEDMPLR
jgi:hypothetical protein